MCEEVKPPPTKFWIRIPGAEYEVSRELFDFYVQFGRTVLDTGHPHVASVADGWDVRVSPDSGELLFFEQQLPELKRFQALRSSWFLFQQAAIYDTRRRIRGGTMRAEA
jgi:hypothetical protein